jgi:iron complex outermembrane receptor protein
VVEGQYDFVHAVLADGTYVPKMPPHRLGGGIYYRDVNWLARINLLHAFRQDEFATFDTPTPGYNMLNAELSYTTKLQRQAAWFRRSQLEFGARTCSTTTSATASPTRKMRCCSPG